jgi:hypothetical protein
MKKVILLIVSSLFIVSSNVAGADFRSQWEGYMNCGNDVEGVSPIYFKIEVTKKGNFITSLNITPTPGERCFGDLDDGKISMTCESGNYAYGEVKGKKIYIINQTPADALICKGTATLIGYKFLHHSQ